MIRLRDITVKYGPVEVLRSVTLETPSTGLVTVTGASGSGKSTILNVIGLLLRPTSGTVHMGEEAISAHSRRAQARFRADHLGFVFQAAHLVPWLDAIDNVRLAGRYRHQQVSQAQARMALSNVGVDHRSTHRPSQLSGGERQRVAIARAIVSSPQLLLADEPTGNLDQQTGAGIIELLSTYAREALVIVVTHDPELAAQGDQQVRLVDGGIATCAT